MSFLANISEPNNNSRSFRIGVIAGFLIYSAFACLDYFMLPSSYQTAWKIRFYLVGPTLIFPLLFSYYNWFHKYLNFFTNLLVGVAQFGIFLMIFTAKPFESAYYDYYMGLVLVILWAAFIFKIRNPALIVFTIITWVIYIFYMVRFQHLLSYGLHSPQFAVFLNNTIFLVCMSSLAVLGNFLIDEYYSKLLEEKKNLQIALKKAQESDQMKSSFLSNMSHEIRTPLNAIIGFSNIMVNDDDYENFGSMAEVINRQGLQLLTVVDSILKFTEIQTKSDLKEKSKIEGKDLFKCVRREFEYIQNKFEKSNISISLIDNFELRNKVFIIHKDALLDVIKIQIENAFKFSTEGEISLEIGIINGSGLLLKFKDEGIGISEGKASEIFENFVQIESGHNRKYEGIGLGLSHAKKLVELMDGSIWYEKNTGPGSSFYTHIPDCVRMV